MMRKATTSENLQRLKETLTWIMQCRAAQAETDMEMPAVIDECDEFGINQKAALNLLAHNAELREAGKAHAEEVWRLLESGVAYPRRSAKSDHG